ncbi:hypothetical protein DPEC_G00277830 [Dallia pectoralis]|uniref:Uncharacterized protein n=1 Tax=Dallia pectoralis TaxID=75939 RepID=A0ACC2FM25_DALPE|nr:hypothetical protein DPEC_G00277830 [Dallia pectoralis]
MGPAVTGEEREMSPDEKRSHGELAKVSCGETERVGKSEEEEEDEEAGASSADGRTERALTSVSRKRPGGVQTGNGRARVRSSERIYKRMSGGALRGGNVTLMQDEEEGEKSRKTGQPLGLAEGLGSTQVLHVYPWLWHGAQQSPLRACSRTPTRSV